MFKTALPLLTVNMGLVSVRLIPACSIAVALGSDFANKLESFAIERAQYLVQTAEL
jgi:hypothetical protein